MLTDKELLEAWNNAFDEPIYLDHKPTEDDLILIRIKAVLKAVGMSYEEIKGLTESQQELKGGKDSR